MKKGMWRAVLYGVLLCLALGAAVWRLGGVFEGKQIIVPEVTFGAAKETKIPQGSYQRYLLLYQESDPVADTKLTLNSLEHALLYAKWPYDKLSFSEWAQAERDLDPYRSGAVIVIGERQAGLARPDVIARYVREGGGTLVMAMRSPDSPLNALSGVMGTPVFYERPIPGLHWRENLYPGMSEQNISQERFSSSALAVKLEPGVQVWAESLEGQVPLLWTKQAEKGRTLYWNTTGLQEKMMRGIFVESVLKAQGGGAKGAVGAQVWYIDDYPAPAYDRVSEGNTTGYTDTGFRMRAFNPDMQALAQRYGLRYSSGVIFDYNDRTAPPFELTMRDRNKKLYDLEVGLIRAQGELGLHGYNHLPLKLSYTEEEKAEYGYPAWTSPDAIREALRTARGLWPKEVHGALPTMYIPPSNVLSREGKLLLLEAFPEIRTISSIYVSNKAYAGYEQEFLPDEEVPRVMGTPRLTSGFVMEEDQLPDLYGGVGSLGIVSHFNHPDDVFHEERNRGQGWPTLRDGFEKLVQAVKERFPWLEPLTATELADRLHHYHAADVRFERSRPNRLEAYATPLAGPMFVEVRVDQPERWQVKEGGMIVHRDAKHGLLWVRMTEPHLVVEAAT